MERKKTSKKEGEEKRKKIQNREIEEEKESQVWFYETFFLIN